ncbi:MAG: FixH family protein [Candidatus Xenobia bacterium]
MKKRVEVWPVGIVAVFVVFACVILSMVTIAAKTFQGPDDDHYYENGLHYDAELKREAHQARLGWQVHVDWASGRVVLHVLDASGHPLDGATAVVKTTRPATRIGDRRWVLAETSPGTYAREVALPPGEWDLRVDVQRGRDDYRMRRRCTIQ